eukprot:7575402-Pyramimonas_sp.AAC.1
MRGGRQGRRTMGGGGWAGENRGEDWRRKEGRRNRDNTWACGRGGDLRFPRPNITKLRQAPSTQKPKPRLH